MVASLVRRAPFSARAVFGVAVLLAGTDQAAYQDLASLFIHQPGVAERARNFAQSGSFAALRTATFSLPNPLGTMIPRIPIPDHFEVLNAALSRAALEPSVAPEPETREKFSVNREAKGNRLLPSFTANVQVLAPRKAEALPTTRGAVADDAHLAVIDVEPSDERPDFAGIVARAIEPVPPSGALVQLSRLFFGADQAELPPQPFEHAPPSPVVRLASLSGPAEDATLIARKGVVTGDEATPKTPGERLTLAGAKRAKAEKCLADAVYFESRGEPELGQIAVAQVVINRVFSGFYPEDVCATVYQNAHRYLACQFTFACEGKKLVVNDQPAWDRAMRIARDMLDGKLWLTEVGKATHYHAYWVRPAWVREMRTIKRIGVHTFYRPRAWEEGES
ncbi:MAG TPA: cell wall hydrolase [Xanthobacteraceae bacterium]|jgi:spore germination cell wall hydrolase CwlJ-like protein